MQQETTTYIKTKPIMVALILGAFISLLTESLLLNALPDLTKAFNIPYTTVQWVLTAFLLLMGILAPMTGLIQKWFTTRQLYIGALVIFLIGSILAASSPNFIFLLLARIFQAIGTGLIVPVLINTVMTIYPPQKRGGAMGIVGLVMTFAPAIGPSISGAILNHLSWRWLFILVIPITIVAIIVSLIFLKNVTEITKPKIDSLSIVFSTIGFGGVVYGVGNAGTLSWGSMQVIIPLLIGIVFVVLFVFRQLRLETPVLDLSIFKFRAYTMSTIIVIALMMIYYAMLSLIPVMLQNAFVLTAFLSGVVMLPGSATNGLIAPLSGKLYDKFGARNVIVPGFVIIALAMAMYLTINADTSITYIIVAHIILMFGISLVNTPNQTNGMNQLSLDLYPHGTAAFTTIQQVSGAIATALFFSVMAKGQTEYLKNSHHAANVATKVSSVLAGLHSAYLLGFGVALVGVVLALLIRKNRILKDVL